MIIDATRLSIKSAIDQAKPGTWILYHVGFLWNDRFKSKQLNDVAREVRKRSNSKISAGGYGKPGTGEVTMVQRRLGDMTYEYYCVKL